jgi:hypothetical protein
MKIKLTIALWSLLALVGAVGGHSYKPARAPERIELRDQFDVPQRLVFPHTKIVVLMIADRTGSAQVQGWVGALDSHYATRIDLRGLADVSGVPNLLRDAVRRKLRQMFSYRVMLDWTGEIAAALGHPQNEAVVLVIAPDGEIVVRVNGPARDEDLKKVGAAIDALLPRSGGRD